MKSPGKMLGELLKTVVRRPATELYPAVKKPMPAGFRGRLVFHPEKCIGCKLCMRDCPASVIEIRKVGEAKIFEAVMETGRCIYCGQCVDSCNKEALTMTDDFELATLNPETLKVTFHAKPGPDADTGA